MNKNIFSNFIEFQYQAEKALNLVQNLSSDDKVRAAILWNSLYHKLQAITEAEEILNCQNEDISKKMDETSISKPACFQDPTTTFIDSPCTTAEELRLDDDRVIDKVLDEVIHLEAEAAEGKCCSESHRESSSSFLPPISKDDIMKSLSEPETKMVSSDFVVLESSHLPVPDSSRKEAVSKLWSCTFCKSEFQSEESLHDHEKQHQKPFKCTECPSSFSQRGNLNVHLRSHTGERKFSCSKCPKRFTTSGNLRRHLLSHLKLKPYRCSICHSCFTEKKSLLTHQRAHSGERPFSCPHCPRKFTQNPVLRNHLSTHSAEKNFPCSKCTKSFKQRAHLQRHIAYLHSGIKNCVCAECGFAFVTKADLNRHLRSHRGDKAFVCEHCGKKFMRQENLTEHINHLHQDSE